MNKVKVERDTLETLMDQVRETHGHQAPQGTRCAVCNAYREASRALQPPPKKLGLVQRVGLAGLLALMAMGPVGCHFGLGVRIIDRQTGKPGITIQPPFPCEGIACDNAGP